MEPYLTFMKRRKRSDWHSQRYSEWRKQSQNKISLSCYSPAQAMLEFLCPGILILTLTVGAAGTAPKTPAKFPSTDQTVMITGDYLTDPLVTEALAIVNAVVPQSLLSISPSTYIKESSVTYNADAASTCYWPSNQCIRTADGTGYVKDVYTCLGTNQWGLSYGERMSLIVIDCILI
ncbi:hypothetical protein HK096_009004 [Nowakowskiella sp. JEL0078]|nr:hypothetical protein HK096_009004 [Nowakowskiella sp. JEL0078]